MNTERPSVIHWIIRAWFARPLLALLLALGGGAVGALWLSDVPRDVFPDLSAPVFNVIVQNAAMAPEELESSISVPLEAAIAGVPQVKRVRSNAQLGVVQVTVEFEPEADYYRSRQLVAERVAQVAPGLPPGTEPPLLSSLTGRLNEIFEFTLEAEPGVADLMTLRELADFEVRSRLLAVPGVSAVERLGGYKREFQVLLDPERMAARNVALDDVLHAVRGSNSNAAGGFIVRGPMEWTVRAVGRVTSLDDVRATIVARIGGVPVLLGDVADVREGPAVRRGIAHRLRGEVVSCRVSKQFGADTTHVAAGIRSAIEEIRAGLPKGVELRTVYDQSDLVRSSLGGVGRAVLVGAVLVVLVLLLLLGNLRAAMLVTLTLPLSVALSGLLLEAARDRAQHVDARRTGDRGGPVGRRRDHRHRKRGAPDDRSARRRSACFRAGSRARSRPARRLRDPDRDRGFSAAVLDDRHRGSNVSTARGRGRRRDGGFAGARGDPGPGGFRSLPRAATAGQTRRRLADPRGQARLHAAARCVFEPRLLGSRRGAGRIVPALWLALGRGPTSCRGWTKAHFLLQTTLPPEASLDEVDRLNHRLEDVLREFPEVEDVVRRTGRAEQTEDPMPHTVSDVLVVLRPDRKRSLDALENAMRERVEKVPALGVLFTTPIGMRIDEGLGGSPADLSVRIFGPDLDRLTRAGRTSPHAHGEHRRSGRSARREAHRPATDPRRNGSASARPGRADAGGCRRCRAHRSRRRTDLRGLGRSTSLRSGGSASGSSSRRRGRDSEPVDQRTHRCPRTARPGRAHRRNLRAGCDPARSRAAGELPWKPASPDEPLSSAASEVSAKLHQELALPAGYFLEVGGRVESQARALRSLGVAVGIAVLAVFALLYMALGRMSETLVILATLPDAFVGGIVALAIAGETWNVSSLVGLIGLFGIAVQNGLVLVTQTRALVARACRFVKHCAKRASAASDPS